MFGDQQQDEEQEFCCNSENCHIYKGPGRLSSICRWTRAWKMVYTFSAYVVLMNHIHTG